MQIISSSKTIENCLKYAKELLAPKSTEPVWVWAERNVRFNEPGNTDAFTTRLREYVREPMEMSAKNDVKDIVLVFGSQTAKTSSIMGLLAHATYNKSIRAMFVMPNQELAENFAETRWIPLLKASVTSKLLPKDPRKTKKALQFIGSSIVGFVGSNSPANLASFPCDWVIADEVDKFNSGTDKEADAVNLAEQRVKGKVLPKKIKTSTPTTEGGLIWQEYLKGNQCRYNVPCPHCGQYVVFAWAPNFCVLPKIGNEAYIYWDRSAKVGGKWNYEKVIKTAHAKCPFCEGKIYDVHKTKMIREGKWIETNPLSSFSFKSFHLPSLYSNDTENSFSNLSVKFLEASQSLQGLQGFVNGDLAEPWVSQEMVNRTELVISSTTQIDNESEMLVLTADYQLKAPYVWFVVRAWKENGDSRLVDYGNCESFDELSGIQEKHKIPNTRVVIDSGFDTAKVYEECAKHGKFGKGIPPFHIGWIPSKGSGEGRYWLDKKTKLKTCFGFGQANLTHHMYTMSVLEYNADMLKDILRRMRLQKTKEKWAVTDIATEDYWLQMNAETKREVERNGRVYYEWRVRSSGAPNHLFDCENMQLAFAMFVGRLSVALPFQKK